MQEWIGKKVVFTDRIEEMECYPEVGMRARVVAINSEDTDSDDLHEHVYCIKFDYSEYDDFNRLLETANYYGRDGIPNKTARESGHYSKTETIYFGSPLLFPFENYFRLASEHHQKLHEQFHDSGEQNYVEWLEKQVEAE